MCKRNSPHKNKASNGCVRETQHGMCKRNFPQKNQSSWVVKEKLPPEKQSRHGMCKRNKPACKDV